MCVCVCGGGGGGGCLTKGGAARGLKVGNIGLILQMVAPPGNHAHPRFSKYLFCVFLLL